MNPYVLIGAVVILAISHSFAFIKGRGWERNDWNGKVIEQTEKVRETERVWQNAYNEASKSYLARIGVINDRLHTALNGLRDRPDRPVPGATGTDCKGATGAELSRQDVGFLFGEAARADRLRTALGLCYSTYDSLRK